MNISNGGGGGGGGGRVCVWITNILEYVEQLNLITIIFEYVSKMIKNSDNNLFQYVERLTCI